MTRLYLVRHGQTEWNAIRCLQGGSEVPLNDAGRAQATGVAQRLAAVLDAPVVLVSSDLSRAADTAAAIGAAVGVEPALDLRLRERRFGVWEGTTEPERIVTHAEDVARWYRGETPRIDGFETTEDLAARLTDATTEAVARGAGADVVLVSHGSALRTLLNALMGVHPAARVFSGLENAHWSLLTSRPDGAWSLARHNVGRD